MTDKPINKEKKREWWTPIWTGLVIDQEATHLKKMRMAIWLFLYFLLTADRHTGILFRKVKTISRDTGINPRTLRYWLGLLRQQGYITTRRTGHSLMIQTHKWKGVFAERSQRVGQVETTTHDLVSQRGHTLPVREAQTCPSEKGLYSQNPQHLRHKSATTSDANDNDTKEILPNDILASQLKTLKNTEGRPSTREELLAWDLAETLHDTQGFPFYLACAKRYPEDLLRRIASEVKLLPAHKITRSRGALFNHLLQQYVHDATHHSEDQS